MADQPETGFPSLSVVVTTHNRCDRLEAILRPLLADADVHEIIVIDDASDDGTIEFLHRTAASEPRLRPVRLDANVGQPRARRFGVEKASGDIVLSLDDDVVVGSGLARGHRAHHARLQHAIVLGYMPTDIPAKRTPGRFATEEYAEVYERQADAFERDPEEVLRHLWGGNFSFRRQDFLEVTDGYDFPLTYFEDRDLGLRFAKRGARPVFDRRLAAMHRHTRALTSYLSDGRNAGAGLVHLHRAHRDVLEPLHPDASLRGYSRGLRWTIRIADLPGIRRVTPALLERGARTAGMRSVWRLERRLGVIGKHVAERDGIRRA